MLLGKIQGDFQKKVGVISLMQLTVEFVFTDQVANLQRRNTELQNKLHAAIQQNQISQVTLITMVTVCCISVYV